MKCRFIAKNNFKKPLGDQRLFVCRRKSVKNIRVQNAKKQSERAGRFCEKSLVRLQKKSHDETLNCGSVRKSKKRLETLLHML